jgi:tight adherence protein B
MIGAVGALVAGCVIFFCLAVRSTSLSLTRRRLLVIPDAREARGVPSGEPRARRDLAAPIIGATLGALLIHAWVGILVGFGVGEGVRKLRHTLARRKSEALLDQQLADAVGAMSSALRAGMSLPQALGYAADEAEAPASDGFRQLVTSVELGSPLDEAVRAWAAAVGTEDARLIAGAISMHRRSGGDLPAVLDRVAATVRERVEASQEVRALTAQGRMSGAILGALPVGFFAFLWLTARRDIEGALGTPAGQTSILVGLVLEVSAFLWIRKLLEVT